MIFHAGGCGLFALAGRGGQDDGVVAGRGRAEDAFDCAEVLLLLPDDRPRPHDAQPPHRLPRREAVRAHQPQRDERPRPAPAVIAVHGDGAGGGVDDGEEGSDNGAGRAGGLVEAEVKVLEAVRGEGVGVVARLVEADDGADPHFGEDLCIVGRAEHPPRRPLDAARPLLVVVEEV